MFQVMIGVMINLKNCAETHGRIIRIIFVLTGLKRRNKEDIVYVMKIKTHI